MKRHPKGKKRFESITKISKSRETHDDGNDRYPMKQGYINKLMHTPKVCSCCLCGNPRRHFNERTVQEKKWACRERDQVHEYYDSIKEEVICPDDWDLIFA